MIVNRCAGGGGRGDERHLGSESRRRTRRAEHQVGRPAGGGRLGNHPYTFVAQSGQFVSFRFGTVLGAPTPYSHRVAPIDPLSRDASRSSDFFFKGCQELLGSIPLWKRGHLDAIDDPLHTSCQFPLDQHLVCVETCFTRVEMERLRRGQPNDVRSGAESHPDAGRRCQAIEGKRRRRGDGLSRRRRRHGRRRRHRRRGCGQGCLSAAGWNQEEGKDEPVTRH
jgi:hypothetical protein